MGIIELQNVSYADGDQTIIHHVDLSVSAGDSLTISGPSGCGKSTLLKLIASLISPTSGTISFNGKNQTAYDYPTYRQQVSYCFQQPTLFDNSVRDNLKLPFQIRSVPFDEARIGALLELVDLPLTFLDKKVIDLSGGEKQRIALIRNLVFPPQVLLLDEVTVGLDTRSKTIVQALIKNVQEQTTTVIQVTHDETEIAAATHLIEMRQGALQK
ncbi:ATP-binding cassette domain-containing protein [Lapidilactobacillus achengensis]|uniref:ATP-binding cassette domain-containing protein n=1 Tax=Lapidilactobacillus achengensis TaxID=2486000 RepID=A0ABW1USG8_9LACO|nr:ATP-binding cassette domain-containing protein [Lapidilactobacillus achengensis]